MGFPALDFENKNSENTLTPAAQERLAEMRDFLAFLQKPHTAGGIDNLKLGFRNVIIYMMAMSGDDNGYNYSAHGDEGFSSLSTGNAAERALQRKKKRRKFIDDLNALEKMLAQSFETLFKHTQTRLHDFKKKIDQRIIALDHMIHGNQDGFFSGAELQDAKAELQELKALKEDVKTLETKLENTNSSLEVVKIEEKLEKKISKFEHISTDSATATNAAEPDMSEHSAVDMVAVAMAAESTADMASAASADSAADADTNAEADTSHDHVAAVFSESSATDSTDFSTASDAFDVSDVADFDAGESADASFSSDAQADDASEDLETFQSPADVIDTTAAPANDDHFDGGGDDDDGEEGSADEDEDMPPPAINM